jgi:integrase
MSRGNITRRGTRSWRLKFDVGVDAKGKRKVRYVTVKGARQDAQKELTRLLAQHDAGTLPEPSKLTVAEYLRSWLGEEPKEGEVPPAPPADLSPKTAERYRELAEGQIIPHLGTIQLQKLKPAKVKDWHETLLKSGSRKGKPLAPQTVGHAHRVLHRALERAMESEILSRNVAGIISPPKVRKKEIEILTADEIADTLAKLDGHPLYPIAVVDLATGLRRGELLALRLLVDVDLDAGVVEVRRSLEETKAGLRFKEPKTEMGRRTLSLPPSALAVLREHRKELLKLRLALGLGKPDKETLLFSEADGTPTRPNQLSWLWRSAVKARKCRRVSFHALRHTHVSALIAAGLDVVAISRRIGHANPTVTLNTYGHLFKKDDSAAVAAIEAALRTGRER